MGEGELKVKLKMGVDFIGTTGRKRFKKWSFWLLVSLMWSIVMLFAYVKLYVYIYIAQANPITLNVRPPPQHCLPVPSGTIEAVAFKPHVSTVRSSPPGGLADGTHVVMHACETLQPSPLNPVAVRVRNLLFW